MKCGQIAMLRKLTIIVLLTIFAASAGPAIAESPVKLKGEVAINVSSEGPAPFSLSGTASHLGQYTCYGELDLLPGPHPGSQDGHGVAVFEAANGDLLVGVATCELDADGAGEIKFSWRDSIEFGDGTVVHTTGRFVKSRPPGAVSSLQYHFVYNQLVVIAIIAILIG